MIKIYELILKAYASGYPYTFCNAFLKVQFLFNSFPWKQILVFLFLSILIMWHVTLPFRNFLGKTICFKLGPKGPSIWKLLLRRPDNLLELKIGIYIYIYIINKFKIGQIRCLNLYLDSQFEIKNIRFL